MPFFYMNIALWSRVNAILLYIKLRTLSNLTYLLLYPLLPECNYFNFHLPRIVSDDVNLNLFLTRSLVYLKSKNFHIEEQMSLLVRLLQISMMNWKEEHISVFLQFYNPFVELIKLSLLMQVNHLPTGNWCWKGFAKWDVLQMLQ